MDLPNIDDTLNAQPGLKKDASSADKLRAATLPVHTAKPADVDAHQGLPVQYNVGREDPPLPPWPQLPARGWQHGHRRRREVGREDPPLPPWPQMPIGGWHQHVNNDIEDRRKVPAVHPPSNLTLWGYTILVLCIEDYLRLLHLVHNVYCISAAILGRTEANAILFSWLFGKYTT